MIYCANCSTVLMERTLLNHPILICPLCGALYEPLKDKTYRYRGTTGGNQVTRELLPITDEGEQ